jgi:ABC-type transporter Mla maintaining outer membrane lipid asymmetry ATPase subunit MlaF
MNPSPIIRLDSVGIRRPDDSLPLLEGVDWTVFTGDWWEVTGAHGSGKTALLLSLAGLIPTVAGTITAFGDPVVAGAPKPPGWVPRVGLVFEGGGRLLRDRKVAENIALPIGYHRNSTLPEAIEQVWPWIETLDLERLADAPAGRIGRAWAQRVALARALSLDPEVLLLDNPTVGMDETHSEWWQGFLIRLRQGHPLLKHRPMTLIETTDAPRIGIQPQPQRAHLENSRLLILPPTRTPGIQGSHDNPLVRHP